MHFPLKKCSVFISLECILPLSINGLKEGIMNVMDGRTAPRTAMDTFRWVARKLSSEDLK